MEHISTEWPEGSDGSDLRASTSGVLTIEVCFRIQSIPSRPKYCFKAQLILSVYYSYRVTVI